jgi:hypothetical protein
VLELPAPARLAAWGTAALAGAVGAQACARRVAGPEDAGHRLAGLPGEPEPVDLADALTALGALGVTDLRLVLPRPGDVAGLPGPPPFNEEAVTRGAAVLTVSGPAYGVLHVGRAAWTAHEVLPSPPSAVALADAERALTDALREAADDLARLAVDRWSPRAADLLSRLRAAPDASPLPPSFPPRAHRVVALGGRLLAVVDVARTDHGAAVSAGQMALRSAALRDLDAAARRAVEAACSAPGRATG